MCLEDIEITAEEMTTYLLLPGMREIFTEYELRQVHQFRENVSAFGSLIQPILSLVEIIELKSRLASLKLDDLQLGHTHAKVLRVLDQAEMLSPRYQIVVANPPYMGSNKFNAKLKLMASDGYKEGKADLYSCFLLRNLRLLLPKGLNAMITLPNWMFLGPGKNFARNFSPLILYRVSFTMDEGFGDLTLAVVLSL
jgi:hypothetical protein